jgi:membrane-bound serine protease (ClpP class)
VVIIVIGIALFYLFAMTTVVRSRFSTPTIGREHLIGRTGIAESDIDPDGLVSVDGARWRATAHRAAGIHEGDAVTVLDVREIVLEVGPGDGSP